jgi:hypothetical protein
MIEVLYFNGVQAIDTATIRTDVAATPDVRKLVNAEASGPLVDIRSAFATENDSRCLRLAVQQDVWTVVLQLA